VVLVAVRTSAGSRVHLDAVGNRDGAAARGATAAGRVVRLGAGVCDWFFRRVRFLWCLCDGRGGLSRAASIYARPPGRRFGPAVRAPLAGIADQTERSNRTDPWRIAGVVGRGRTDSSRAAVCRAGRRSFLLAVDHRLLWSGVGALVESRRALAQHQQAARHLEWIPAGFCLRIWMDAVHRSYSYDGAGFGGGERYDFARRGAAGGVFGGAGGAVSADRAGDRTIPEVL